jgi:hypothetical protein
MPSPYAYFKAIRGVYIVEDKGNAINSGGIRSQRTRFFYAGVRANEEECNEKVLIKVIPQIDEVKSNTQPTPMHPPARSILDEDGAH